MYSNVQLIVWTMIDYGGLCWILLGVLRLSQLLAQIVCYIGVELSVYIYCI